MTKAAIIIAVAIMSTISAHAQTNPVTAETVSHFGWKPSTNPATSLFRTVISLPPDPINRGPPVSCFGTNTIQLRPLEDYFAPTNVPFTNEVDRTNYLAQHLKGWLWFASRNWRYTNGDSEGAAMLFAHNGDPGSFIGEEDGYNEAVVQFLVLTNPDLAQRRLDLYTSHSFPYDNWQCPILSRELARRQTNSP